MQRNYRKGVTLAEMCIVLAVVAIVSLSVASFATMAGGRGTAAATKLDAMGDLEIVEAIVESWILEAANREKNIEIAEDGSTIFTTINKNDKIGLSGKTLQVSFPDGEEDIYYNLKSITGLKFDWAGDDAKIYYCTVTYQYRNGIVTKEQTYTFCVYPRVGEIVSGTNSNTGGGNAGGKSRSSHAGNRPGRKAH